MAFRLSCPAFSLCSNCAKQSSIIEICRNSWFRLQITIHTFLNVSRNVNSNKKLHFLHIGWTARRDVEATCTTEISSFKPFEALENEMAWLQTRTQPTTTENVCSFYHIIKLVQQLASTLLQSCFLIHFFWRKRIAKLNFTKKIGYSKWWRLFRQLIFLTKVFDRRPHRLEHEWRIFFGCVNACALLALIVMRDILYWHKKQNSERWGDFFSKESTTTENP